MASGEMSSVYIVKGFRDDFVNGLQKCIYTGTYFVFTNEVVVYCMFVYFNCNIIIAYPRNFLISSINNTPRKIHDIASYDAVSTYFRKKTKEKQNMILTWFVSSVPDIGEVFQENDVETIQENVPSCVLDSNVDVILVRKFFFIRRFLDGTSDRARSQESTPLAV